MMPQSAVRRARLPLDTIGAGLDLHQPLGIEEPPDPDQRRDGLDGAEDFAVGAADLAPAARHGREDPGASHIIEAGAHPGERLADDTQALAGLLVDVVADRRPVVRRRRASRDLDHGTYTHRARVANDALPFSATGDDASGFHGHHSKLRPQAPRMRARLFRAFRSRPTRRPGAP